MKTFFAALILATVIGAPFVVQSAAAAIIDRRSSLWTQDCHVAY